MRKILLITLFIFSSVFAHANVALESQYSLAISAYKERDFKKSYEILSKLYLTKLSDAKLNFYLGRSAYEIGAYEVALGAFERVEMLDSTHMRNKLEMARTYFMLRMYEDSELKFKEILQNPNIPQNVRMNIEMYLAKVTQVQEKSFTYVSASIDLLYDSNVNYGSLDSIYNIGIGTLPAEASESDMAFELFGDVVNIYDIGEKSAYAIKNRLKIFYKMYSDLDAYNIQYISYTPSLFYKERAYTLEFILGYDILHLGSVDYLHTLSVIPRIEYSHTNSLKSICSLKYQMKKFKQTAQANLDAKHYELAYSLQNILSPRSYVQGNFIFMKEQKIQGMRDDVDYNEYRLSLIYANQFTNRYGGEFFGEYRGRSYKDFSTLFGSTREDTGYLFSATLNMKFFDSFLSHLKIDYNRVDSNQGRYAYDKYTVIAGINKSF